MTRDTAPDGPGSPNVFSDGASHGGPRHAARLFRSGQRPPGAQESEVGTTIHETLIMGAAYFIVLERKIDGISARSRADIGPHLNYGIFPSHLFTL